MPRNAKDLARSFGVLIEAIPDAVCLKDGEGRWRTANTLLLQMFNLAGQDWQGRTDMELGKQFPEMAEVYRVCYQNDEVAWALGKRAESLETIPILATGEMRTFEVSKLPLFHEDGSRQGLVILGRDVTKRRQQELMEARQRESLRHLNEIAALSHIPLNDQFHQALAIGAAHLGLEFGIVSHIVGDIYHVDAQASPPDTLHDGQTFPFGITYCSITLEKGDVFAVHDMGNSSHCGHPCYAAMQIETYIGAPLLVDGQVYGTVNFSSPHRYGREFNEGDKEFMQLLARWAGSAIERNQIEQRLTESELQLRTIIETEPECVKLLAADGTVLQMNRAGLEMLDATSPEQLIGTNVQHIIAPKDRKNFADLLRRVFMGESGKLEFEVVTLKGMTRWLETNAVPMRNANSEIVAQLAVTRDITERKRAEERIHQLAYFDELTNLPNRRMLVDRLNQALVNAKRYRRAMAIMFLDLDNFKQINDTLGHAMGDELLKKVAVRLSGCARESDTVSRQSGDEFVIVLTEITQPEDAASVADKILKSMTEPITLGNQKLNITTSIGIAIFPADGMEHASELMKQADMAMYSAKAEGKNQYRFYKAPR